MVRARAAGQGRHAICEAKLLFSLLGGNFEKTPIGCYIQPRGIGMAVVEKKTAPLKGSEDSEMSTAGKKRVPKETFDPPPLLQSVLTYITYLMLYVFGLVSDFLCSVGLKKIAYVEVNRKEDWFKLNRGFETFFTRNMYRRVRDGWNRPIASTPGAYTDLVDRVSDDFNWTFRHLGTKTNCLNLGSYNYLGFAESTGPCADAAYQSTLDYGAGTCSPPKELGTLDIHKRLEAQLARFVGKPAALVFGMGFATNSMNIPALMGKGDLLISDQLNHASLITGAKLSGVTVRVFKHNNVKSLENVLRRAVIEGQPKRLRAWRKIFIMVEGVYSMEGSVCKLPEIVELKKKYKAYLYLDEAHSIGAMGATGRGVCEYWGVDPADVDILMGTFTKSFGSAGGYIAADHDVINYLRGASHSNTYAASMPAPVAQQIITSMSIIMGEDGTKEGEKRIAQLLDNSRYFRKRLHEMKFIVYGNEDSPVVPILIYIPGKVLAFSRELLKKKIAVVVVGFPATSIIEARARICLSASHTREMLDYALKEIDELGDLLLLKK